jgi:hypothetical protein
MSVEIRHVVDPQLGSVSAVVAATLNAAYTLGEARMESGIKYRLFYNAGGASAPVGAVLAPILSAGPYSMTVTTTSQSNAHLGGCVALHATISTGAYFWGAVRGRIGTILGGIASVPTGGAFMVGVNGAVEPIGQSSITGALAVGINLGASASKTITTGAKTGDVSISFMEI